MKPPLTTGTPGAVYHRATVSERDPSAPVPPEQRVPFGWSAFGIPPRKDAPGILLRWAAPLTFAAAPARLRVTVALDVRESKRIEAHTAQTGELLGVFDIRYPSACQPFEIVMSPDKAARAAREGVRLRQVEGERSLHLFDGASGDTPDPFLPHFLGAVSGDKWTQFEARMCSPASLQAFGWIEGCVLDGLWQMSRLPGGGETARTALTAHLRRYVTPGGDLHYEGPGSKPEHNRAYGMECMLPFALVAQTEPQNPVLKLAEREMRARLDKDNAVTDRGNTTTEGVYIAGYPLAAMARAWKRDDLAALALAQLRTRRDRSIIGGKIHQGVNSEGKGHLPNWARGVAWYLLGFARVIETLGRDAVPADIQDEFRRAALVAMPFQRPDGLWGNFIDDPKSVPDTSGSAGIAAALAVGARLGLLPDAARAAAKRAETGLEAYLTPDGYLGGMAQFNKGGEALQRADYRVIAPMAMGLAAQLRAALRTAKG